MTEDTIRFFINAIIRFGVEVFPQSYGEILIDMGDIIFYKVALEKRDDNAYLVIGNQKHYPVKDFIVTLGEMLKIIEQSAK